VLIAFKETNDALTSYRNARKATELKNELREAALKYVELATFQYNYGGVKYIDVLDAQRRYFDAQIGLSNAVRDEYIALVQLYKSLGGGWAQW
jgi:multidrug efflux system outer membrane protein